MSFSSLAHHFAPKTPNIDLLVSYDGSRPDGKTPSIVQSVIVMSQPTTQKNKKHESELSKISLHSLSLLTDTMRLLCTRTRTKNSSQSIMLSPNRLTSRQSRCLFSRKPRIRPRAVVGRLSSTTSSVVSSNAACWQQQQQQQQQQRQYTSTFFPLHAAARKRAVASTAALIEDDWEKSSSPVNSSTSFKTTTTTTTIPSHKLYQLERLEEQQRDLLRAIEEYRNVWYEPDSLNPPPSPLLHWKDAMEFQHPTEGGSWEQLIESEETYKNICTLCHELFMATAHVTQSELSSNTTTTTYNYSGGTNRTKPHDEWVQEYQDLMTSILPFWEGLRKDRAGLFEKLKTTMGDRATSIPAAATPETTKKSWMWWLTSMVGTGEEKDEEVPAARTRTATATTSTPPLMAHENKEFTPGSFHLAKLVGRLYFNYPDQTSDDWMDQRALKIQSIVEQSASSSAPNDGESFLTDKIIRLYVRSYHDIGTLESARQAEWIYFRYPDHQKGLFWHVLMSYLRVTLTPEGKPAPEPKVAALAAKRVYELLTSDHVRRKSKNEFHSWAAIGLQCLSNVHPRSLPSLNASLDEYYDLVHTLCKQKFGTETWEAILSDHPTLPLRPQDGKTLQILIQIYAQDWNYVGRVQTLLETTWRLCPVSDLKGSFKQSTFNVILKNLSRRKGQKIRRSKRERGDRDIVDNSKDFQYALQILDQKMMTYEGWWPNEDTFSYLFQLADLGPDADEVLTQLELFRAVSKQSPMTPPKAAKYVLKSWLLSASDGKLDAARRALEILRSLQVSSKPLIYSSLPSKVTHIYNPDHAPDSSVYTLVIKICAKCNHKETLDIALYAYQCAKDQGISLLEYSSILECINKCDEEERQVALAQEVFDDACSAGHDKKTYFLKSFLSLYPQLAGDDVAELLENGEEPEEDNGLYVK